MANEANQYLTEEKERLELKLEEAKKMGQEPGMKEMADEEVKRIETEIEKIDRAMTDPASHDAAGEPTENFNSIIVEARPGVGGDEAKIWAEELMRMYSRFAENNKWQIEQLDSGVIKLKGKGVFEKLKWETGVHRVQRVPVTEAYGRIHTSTASIVVLPEVAENQIEIREDDLVWEFTRGGGHGGQNVNKVATAVRLLHKPSGIIVQSRQERFQEQNRKIAMALLRSQLWELEQEKKLANLKDQRSKIGRSMRSEKIRTYNFPQNRVTDHRIGKSWHQLDRIIEGDLGNVVTDLAAGLGDNHTGGDDK